MCGLVARVLRIKLEKRQRDRIKNGDRRIRLICVILSSSPQRPINQTVFEHMISAPTARHFLVTDRLTHFYSPQNICIDFVVTFETDYFATHGFQESIPH